MILIIGRNMAMTIVPTTTARKMISAGSMAAVRPATALSTSSSYVFAMRVSMSGSAPVSSPTCTIDTTIGGNTPDDASGSVIDSPSFTASCTVWTARRTTRFAVVSRTITSAWRIGTPEESSVPSVRVNWAIAVRLTSVPITGIFNRTLSKK